MFLIRPSPFLALSAKIFILSSITSVSIDSKILWSPVIGQFQVDTNQAKNDQLFGRPGNFKYSGFRRSLGGDSILESIDTEVMEERMKILAERARKGLGLIKNIVLIG